ncbi:aminoglycoside phosphotransferase family protein [Sphingomonas sp. HF-S4]|uniref:Aminoglycoside phosphotransferase family protein n=1 Tax=Sphingomonas agrestis TaxID=3080540 RepID=A0ABU3Y950_9SPHN|nr:aminoglycoside phosphotransferase family protein [Sphingomonas sp. HF-S4]MDV3457687.1 aminoglycoside phosphotransferase family protein [Sphingomonas sp. HF-S4]
MLKPTRLRNLARYRFRDRGYSAEVFTDADGIALKLYDARFGIDTAHYEYSVLKHLQGTRLACAELVDAVQLGARWGLRYRWIEALPLKDALYARMSEIDQMAQDFARLHADIHDVPGFAVLPTQVQCFNSILALQEHLESPRRRRLMAEVAAMPDADRLCHGDFNPRNTLMDAERGYVIDWQSAYRGDPLGDVAKTWVKLSFFVHRSPLTNEGEKALMARFCSTYLASYRKIGCFEPEMFLRWVELVAGVQSRSDEPLKRDWYTHLVTLAETDPDRLSHLVFGAAS